MGGDGVGVAEVEGAGGVEEEGISAGRALTSLASLKLTVNHPRSNSFSYCRPS